MSLTSSINYLTSLIDTGNDAFGSLYLAEFRLYKENDTTFDGADSQNLTVRCEGFDPPQIQYGTHTVKFVNDFIDLPSPQVNMDRTFTLNFRVDANYSLYKKLLNLRNKIFNPSDSTTLGKASFPTTGESSDGLFQTFIYIINSKTLSGDTIDDTLSLSNSLDTSKTLMFQYDRCWIESISPLTFNSESSDVEKVQIKVNFMNFKDWQSEYNLESKIEG